MGILEKPEPWSGNPERRDDQMTVFQKGQDQDSPRDSVDLKEWLPTVSSVFFYSDLLKKDPVPGMDSDPAEGNLPPERFRGDPLDPSPTLSGQHNSVQILESQGTGPDEGRCQEDHRP
jgi:hypothetical protein